MFDTIQKFFSSLMTRWRAEQSHSLQNSNDSIKLNYSKWKESSLRIVLLIASASSLLGVISGWEFNTLAVSLTYLIFITLMVIVALVKVSYAIRASLLLSMLFFAATIQLLAWGTAGEATLFYAVVIVLATLFFDRIADYLFMGLATIVMVVVAFLSINGLHVLSGWSLLPADIYGFMVGDWSAWISYLMDLLVLSVVPVIAIRLLKREFGRVMQEATSAMDELTASRDKLELGIAERTKALVISNEISRQLSTILDPHQLIVEVVEQLKDAFNYYHTHIYLYEEAHHSLSLAGGTGEVGKTLLARGHEIPLGKGLVGRAAETNSVLLVSDTFSNLDWLPNPLLPETRSEVAVPISYGNQVLGVLDVQHNLIDGLKREDADLLQSIANQVAIALQNARLYANVQQRAEQEALINAIGQKIQETTTVESAMQVVVRELGSVLGSRETRVIVTASIQKTEHNNFSRQ